MNTHCLTLAILLALTGTVNAQSVYKCTKPDGSVTFQDRACVGEGDEKKVRVQRSSSRSRPVGKTNFDVRIVELPGIGDAAVAVFDYMDISRSAGAGRPTQVRIQSKPGAVEKMSMILTFQSNPTGEMNPRAAQENAVRDIARPYTQQFVEQLELLELNSKFGRGLVALVEDVQSTAVMGADANYSTVVAGQIVDSSVTVSITLKTQGVEGKAFSDAFDILKSLVVASDISGISRTPGEVSVPTAPGGFTWQQLPEVTAVILRPNGWFFETAHEGKSLRYHLSRTRDEAGAEGYDAGLTISVNLNLPIGGAKSPAAHAEELIRDASRGQEIVQPQFTGRRGNLVVHGVQIRVEDPDKGFFTAHMVAMANSATGTVYLCIFQAPSDEWAEMWELGQQMISKLSITDSV